MKTVKIIILLLTAILPISAVQYNCSVNHYKQAEDNWCWAACCQMLLDYYGVEMSQQWIANFAVGGLDTGNAISSSIPRLPGEIACDSIIADLGYTDTSSSLGTRYESYALGWIGIVNDINASKPLLASDLIYGIDMHAVVIYGFDSANFNVHYQDPAQDTANEREEINSFLVDHWSSTLEMTTPGPTRTVPVLPPNGGTLYLTVPNPPIIGVGSSATFSGMWTGVIPPYYWTLSFLFEANDGSFVIGQTDSQTTESNSTSWTVQVAVPSPAPAVGLKYLFVGDSIALYGKAILNASVSLPFYLMVPATTQKILLHAGWNMNSFNVVPKNNTTTSVFGSGSGGFLFVKNLSGNIYAPSLGIDDIGHEMVGMGYLVYTSVSDTLKVLGVPVDYPHSPIALSSDWNFIAYFPPTNDSITHALAGIQSSMVLVENDSGFVYWPAHGFDNIGVMSSGQGYKVFMTSAASLIYPAPIFMETSQIAAGNAMNVAANNATHVTAGGSANSCVSSGCRHMLRLPKPRHFFPVHVVTGNNAILLANQVTAGEKTVPDSSEIGAFDTMGNLVGSGVVINGSAVFVVWGQDPQVMQKDGCAPSELVTFKLWDRCGELPLDYLTLNGTTAQYEPDKIFLCNLKVSDIHKKGFRGKIEVAAEVSGSGRYPITKFALTQVYPNPFKGSVNIAFDVPMLGDVSGHAIEIDVYDLNGSLVKRLANGTYQAGHYSVIWNCTDSHEALMGSSVYIVRMNAQNFDKRFKLVRVQ